MSCRVATFAEIHSTKDIDICRKFNDIYVLGNVPGMKPRRYMYCTGNVDWWGMVVMWWWWWGNLVIFTFLVNFFF